MKNDIKKETMLATGIIGPQNVKPPPSCWCSHRVLMHPRTTGETVGKAGIFCFYGVQQSERRITNAEVLAPLKFVALVLYWPFFKRTRPTSREIVF